MLIVFTYWSNSTVIIGYKNYVCNIIHQLAFQHPQDNFIIITNEKEFLIDQQPRNVTIVTVSSSIKLIQHFKEKIQFKKLIQQYQPKTIVNLCGTKLIKHTIPQISLLHYYPIKKEVFQLLQTKKILVFKHQLKKYLTEKYFVNEHQIETLNPLPKKIFQPLKFEQENQIKDGYTDGRNYFICNYDETTPEEVITILKAFAQFKKWQKTNMKLMVVSRYQSLSTSLHEKISTFKFKDDVVILENIGDDKYAKLLATAYGFIHISSNPLNIFPLVEAIYTNTAIISSSNDSFKEIITNAALLIKENTVEEIANALQEMYKNENLRSKLIEQANIKVIDYNINQTAHQFWQIVQNVTQV